MTSQDSLNRPALAFTLALAVTQDIVYALIFLSFMNHYLLDVLGASASLPGYTLALYGGTKLVVHPLAGRLLDVARPRLVYAGALAMQLTALVTLAFIQSLPLFLVAAVLLAAGAATVWPLTYALVAATQPASHRSRIGGILAIVGYASTGIGFALGVLLAEIGGARPAFVAAAAVVALPALAIGGRTLRSNPSGHRPLEAARSDSRRPRTLLLFAAILFFDFAAITAIAGIYGPYARRTLGLSLFHTTLLLIPAGLAAAASLAVVSKYSRRNRRFLEMALLFAVAALGAFALSLTDVPWAASALAVILGLGAGGIAPLVATLLLDAGSGEGGGFLIGSLMSVEGLGAVAGPAAVAFVTGFQGPRVGFAVIAVLFAILASLSVVAFPGDDELKPTVPAS